MLRKAIHQFHTLLILATVALILSACLAPEDLDYTPTAPATEIAPTSAPNAGANGGGGEATHPAVSETRTQLEAILASLPGTINAGPVQWRRTADAPLFVDRTGGVTGRIAFSEGGGGASELTFGVFESVDAARDYYDEVRDQLRTLENAQERDNFPLPNAFGGGTYGSDAIFVVDTIFLRVSVPRFSGTMGDPLVPYARTLFTLLTEGGFMQIEQ
jgi:hypothetical protein